MKVTDKIEKVIVGLDSIKKPSNIRVKAIEFIACKKSLNVVITSLILLVINARIFELLDCRCC